jgi:GT2 family glycosyltransferase
VTELTLSPAMPAGGEVAWDGALWVGALDVHELDSAVGDVTLADSAGYSSARLLVRDGASILGFVECAVVSGAVERAVLLEALEVLPASPGSAVARSAPTAPLPSITVVVCTRDRPEQLAAALDSLLSLDYPDFDVLVVDNAPRSTATADLVATIPDGRLRLVTEPVPGLSAARNTGLRAAHGELVAFTDDDVVVDRLWLRELAVGFDAGEGVACVSGLVPSGELRTAVQRYFDGRVAWSANILQRVFRLDSPPADLPMFPFSVGEFGTGANFAVRRSAAIELGGFDTCFGVGTATGGGEDLDFFTRVLFSGAGLVLQPTAVVWHRHRSDLAALRAQARGYGTGLGAWLTRVLLDRRMRSHALRRAPHALLRLVSKAGGSITEGPGAGSSASSELRNAVARVGWYELGCVLLGPGLYLRERRKGGGPGL